MISQTQLKYQSLPVDTPVPDISHVEPGQWHFWEWWGGQGGLTRAVSSQKIMIHNKLVSLKCGPVITREHGWDFHLTHHRRASNKLHSEHSPIVMFFEPTCAPWSSSATTMEPAFKEWLRQREMSDLQYMSDTAHAQHKAGYVWGLEQPKASELLKLDVVRGLKIKDKAQ